MALRARRAVAALLTLSVALGIVATAEPAAAEGPAQVQLTGHGFGHGRGLGQWGAKGYAVAGWSTAQILDHFYGGTTAGSRPNQGLRVLLCDQESQTLCKGGAGVPQITLTSSAAFDFEQIDKAFAAGTALRITRDAPNNRWLVDQAPGGCGATAFTPVGAGFTSDPTVEVDPDGALLEVCAPKRRTYRGSLVMAVGDVLADGPKPHIVNFVGSEDYLKGVVPSEMPSSWEAEALKAQAVAARSYVLAGDGRFAGFADTCDTTLCQVYLGASNEKATTNAAIDQTAGVVRLLGNGTVARTEFSASTGGYTAGGNFPAVVDDGDAVAGNPHHTWSATLQSTVIEQAYPTIGDLQRLEVTERNGLGAEGGRVVRMRVVGSAATVSVTGDGFRSAVGLKSNWFTPGTLLDRLAAADRFATAAAIAKATFPSAGTAMLARGDGPDSFPDGLAANYLAGRAPGPTLLAKLDELPAATLTALKDMSVKTVRLLGGTGALSAGVATALQNNGFTVERISGEDRFGTAAAAAKAAAAEGIGTVDGKRTAVLSSGLAFPDALAAGSIVFAGKLPQLLTAPGALPPVTATALTDLAIKHVILTGGTGAIATAVQDALHAMGITTERIAGATRYETAVALADYATGRLGFTGAHVDIATGESFPDALTGGPHTGTARGVLVLTTRSAVPQATCSYLDKRAGAVTGGHLFGGTGAIDDTARAALEGCLRPGP